MNSTEIEIHRARRLFSELAHTAQQQPFYYAISRSFKTIAI